MNDVQESVSTWKLEETNFSAFFLLKILNRHWPDWTFGEDIRSVSHPFPWNPIDLSDLWPVLQFQLKQPPTASWISKEKGFSSKIYSVKLFPENGPDFQICVKVIFSTFSAFKQRTFRFRALFTWNRASSLLLKISPRMKSKVGKKCEEKVKWRNLQFKNKTRDGLLHSPTPGKSPSTNSPLRNSRRIF